MTDETTNNLPQNTPEDPMVSLTLEPTFAAEPAAPTAPVLTETTPDAPQEVVLTPQEEKQIDDFAKTINIHDSAVILQYGSGAQKKMTDFSESALKSVRSKDLGEIGDMLTGLVTEIKNFDTDSQQNSGGLFGLFKKGGNKISGLKARYSSAETNVNQIAKALSAHQVTLLKDISMLDRMYDQNALYYKELTMYILAAKRKLKELNEQELPALQEKARQSGLPQDAQAANDLANLIDRFEKKVYDLDLTRTICIQMGPQIRLIQNNDTLMSEKIQSTLVNTIPLWKSQMVLALGVEHSSQAAKAQREVTDMTNALLRKNAEKLKTATIETAKESERGIVDIETLKMTNQNLIDTLDEVVRIQNEGREQRAQAEVELGNIENELKTKLLELRK